MTLEQTKTAQRHLRPYATRILVEYTKLISRGFCKGGYLVKAWLDGGAVRTFTSLYAVKDFCKRRRRRLASEAGKEG